MKHGEPDNRVFIIGCGYIGVRLAAALHSRGRSVSALARSPERTAHYQSLQIHPVTGDLDNPDSLKNLPTHRSIIFYLAPPAKHGHTDQRMRTFCGAVRQGSEPEKIVYISTSGVYGDCRGNWVAEDTPVNPETDRAKRRVDAEQVLLEWGNTRNVPVVILRVPGIYGPGRLPIDRIKKQLPILHAEDSPFSNRIHADDLVAACIAASDRGRAGGIYNISDGCPGTMSEFINLTADVFGLPRPPVVRMAEAEQILTPSMFSFLRESRRLDITKMQKELSVTIQYPDLESGLQACLDRTD